MLLLSGCSLIPGMPAHAIADPKPPGPADLDFRIGDVYRTKCPLLVNGYTSRFSKTPRGFDVSGARKQDGQPERYPEPHILTRIHRGSDPDARG